MLRVVSQQDISEGPHLMYHGAPPYFVLPVVSHFTGWWTRRLGPTKWLPRNPCLNLRDFTVWIQAITYLLTHLLTPWSRDLLEKLTGFQPVKKFLAFYGTRRFITAFTTARHMSLS